MGFNQSAAWLKTIQKKLKKPAILFLDFDGTLVPIVREPNRAVLSATTRQLLRSLSQQIPIVIISGRSLNDIKSRIRLSGLTYIGNHGFEIRGRSLKFRIRNAIRWRRWIRRLSRELKTIFSDMPGIQVEDKGYSLSVHYRQAQRGERQRAARMFSRKMRPYEDQKQVRIYHGKAVWEVRPPIEWHKGHAVIWVLKQPVFRGRWPLYMGDDTTDQDAFRAIRNRGLGIMVGPSRKKGAAHYTIESPGKVHGFLRWFLEQVPVPKKRIAKSI